MLMVEVVMVMVVGVGGSIPDASLSLSRYFRMDFLLLFSLELAPSLGIFVPF